jgi:hypothetical protein
MRVTSEKQKTLKNPQQILISADDWAKKQRNQNQI